MTVSLSSLRIEATLDASAYVAGANAKAASDAKMVDSGAKLATTLTQTEQKLGTQTTAVERLKNTYIDGYRESANYQKALDNLNRFMDQGRITSAEYDKALTGIQARYASHSTAAKGVAEATQAVGTAARFSYVEMEILRSGLVNTVQSLAAGESAARTLQTQLFQTAPAFGAVARSIGGLGTVAAIAGVTALAAGFVTLVARAIETNSSVRSFSVLLRGMASDTLVGANQLENAAKQLRNVGLSATDARSAITDVIRAGINPAAAPRVVTTAQNLVPVLGSNAPQQLTSALSGGLDSTIKLGQAIHALSTEEVNNYREMARHGQYAQALDQAFAKIEQSVKGLNNDALSPAAKQFRDLGIAWNNMIDALSKTSAIQGTVRLMTQLADAMERLANGKPPAWLSTLLGAATPGVGALGGYLIGSSASSGSAAGQPVATAPIPPRAAAGTGSAAAGVAEALSMVGLNENRDASAIRSYLQSGGSNLDPQTVAWCAAFANAVLARQGIAGTGSNLASSFLNYGTAVTGDVAAGDILATRGHVGFATGATNLTDRGLMLEMVSGNHSDSVARSWVSASSVAVRRAPGASGAAGAAGDAASISNPLDIDKQTDAVNQLTKARAEQLAIEQRVGAQAQILQAARDAEIDNVAKGITGDQAARNVADAVANAKARVAAESAKVSAAAEVEVLNTSHITDAYLKSSQAGIVAEATAQATTEVYQRQGPVANQLAAIEQRRNQILVQQQETERLRNAQDTIAQRDTQAGLQLEISLQGQSSDEITKQLTLLRAKQQIEEQFPLLSEKEKDARLAAVAATADLTEKLAEAQRAQQRIEGTFQSLASTVENTLGQAIQNVFDPSRATDWAQTIRTALGSLTSQLIDTFAVKPLLGSLAGILGFGNTAQQFGTLGSLFGGSSSSSTAASGSMVLTPNGSGGFNLSTLGNAASLANSIGSASSGGGIFGSGGLFSGAGSFINSVGASTGLFASPAVGGLSAGAMADLGIPGVETGLFGGLTATSALPFVGLAAGAGLLISQLFAKKPSNNSTGALIDLASGGISDYRSSGNAQNDATAQQITTSISQFTKQLLATTGGSLNGGSINVQAGTRDGIKLSGGIGDISGTLKFADAQTAISTAELGIAQNLQGVSATVKQVISTVTDPSQIQAAVQFAATYDNLKTAADSAFSSISSDTQAEGPFAQALDQIKQTFADLADQATQFGLSLDPVSAGLAEATKRLSGDFNKSIGDMITAITDPVQLAIAQEKQAGDARVKEAQAVAGNIAQVNKLNAMTLTQIWTQQTQSLQQLSDSLKTGAMSGLSTVAQLSAANDNFRRELRLVQGGNLSEATNLATAGTNTLQLASTAYGNGPQTAALRASVLSAVDQVLSHRSFASGTPSTPAGWIRVGERGPEWMYQGGGATVLPNGSAPANGDLVGEMRALRAEVAAFRAENTKITQGVGVETINQLRGVNAGVNKPMPPQPTERRRVA